MIEPQVCCGDPDDCLCECDRDQIASDVLEQPYFDAAGNEGTLNEVNA